MDVVDERNGASSGTSRKVAHKPSFVEEWAEFFGARVNLDRIEQCCLSGKLRGSHVRSIIWRILLKCLPVDRSEWCSILSRSRRFYVDLKAKVLFCYFIFVYLFYFAIEEWAEFFGARVNLDRIEQCCLSGKLRGSHVRSIIWRILLKCLPVDRSEWCSILSRSRRFYVDLKAKLTINPHCDEAFQMDPEMNNPLSLGEQLTINPHCDEAFQMDPEMNNPLSLGEQNPWQQYFADEDLRECINRDVERTFPELQFFQEARTRTWMSDILFVYGKRNPHIAYKQGMHEILAPLLFVLYFDHQAFAHLMEQNGLSSLPQDEVSILRAVNDPAFIEHDAFELFTQLMMLLECWYISGDEKMSRDDDVPSKDDVILEPFCRSQDTGPSSELIQKLRSINNDILAVVDPVLHAHLLKLDVAPQLYGIRWIRLLFGREFPIHDLLFVWDAILAHRPPLSLIDYIFVAMLEQIRVLLLDGDFSACMQYLMRYPPVVDVHSFVQLALHIKSPKKYHKPRATEISNFANITVAGVSHPNRNRGDAERRPHGPSPVHRVVHREVAQHERKPVGAIVSKIVDTFTEHSVAESADEAANADAPYFVSNVEVDLLKDQVACLQSRLNDVDYIAAIASKRIAQCIEEIESMEGNESVKRRVAKELRSVNEQLTRTTVSEASVRYIGGIRDGTPERGGVELAREASTIRSPAPPRGCPPTRQSVYGDAELVEITRGTKYPNMQNTVFEEQEFLTFGDIG
ncbi:TBC1 domain family member 5 [Toxocara canis]|uniref:TBC1 domain family member 5 n=1 Tax=Toxocara canis TaxID=6265 RepID=A0A0B2UYU6_TOXCA|nr:TBC1 domain family member 5 [Toxocara canis]